MSDPSIHDIEPATGPSGQQAHPAAIEHTGRLRRKLYRVGDHAWSLVGNGLSNQNFVAGPDGLIAIDTGESIEEMRAALTELRTQTDKPIVACIYTHFHYVGGTRAIMEEPGSQGLQIYGHKEIPANMARFGGEVAPRSNRGLVHQFGTALPAEGPDAMLSCGLGRFLRNPEHAPFTAGYVPAQHTFDQPKTYTIAGLTVELSPAPSDATDSITIWFPELELCVNNLVWPSLFNIYAIRGEEYRDPRVLLDGFDHILALKPTALIGTHGPPVTESANDSITQARDAVQFIWDQTVRGINRGLTLDELVQRVRLPEQLKTSYITQEFYGLVEHHVRQIHAGLFGWLDEDESHLFPLPTQARISKLIAGFGGADRVRKQCATAVDDGDYRWALELATWLARMETSTVEDQMQLANVLRAIGVRTTSANVRNWCLTKALEWDGSIDLSRFREHRFSYNQVLSQPPTRFVPTLRVLLDPTRAAGIDAEIGWQFTGGERVGLHLRNQVAVPTDGQNAELSLTLSHETWADLLSNRTTLAIALDEGVVSIHGDDRLLQEVLSCFDHPAFASAESDAAKRPQSKNNNAG